MPCNLSVLFPNAELMPLPLRDLSHVCGLALTMRHHENLFGSQFNRQHFLECMWHILGISKYLLDETKEFL